MKIYLASSSRNPNQPQVLKALRLAGHYVYDFTDKTPHPKDGVTPPSYVAWGAIDPDWRNWSPVRYLQHINLFAGPSS